MKNKAKRPDRHSWWRDFVINVIAGLVVALIVWWVTILYAAVQSSKISLLDQTVVVQLGGGVAFEGGFAVDDDIAAVQYTRKIWLPAKFET